MNYTDRDWLDRISDPQRAGRAWRVRERVLQKAIDFLLDIVLLLDEKLNEKAKHDGTRRH